MLTLTNFTRRNKTPETAAREGDVLDPFRLMRELVGWEPFVEAPAFSAGRAAYAPSFEVKETHDAYVFKADLPGVKEENLEISLTGNRLTIGGKREQEKREQNDRYFAYERSYGSFSRAFTLPDGCDDEHVAADLKEGVLTLVIPKKPEVQPRRIPVGGKPKA
jgi:HSP20 family protein